MRFLRIMLVLVFAVLAVFYTMNGLFRNRSDTNEGPVLECSSEVLDLSVRDSRKVMLRGVTASDAQDGDLTDQVIISGVSKLVGDDTARVTYVVFDSDDNMTTMIRQIHYTDYRSPRFYLTEPLRYSSSKSVTVLDRLQVTDVIDGDITHNVRVSYAREMEGSNLYTITAKVTNSMGDTVELDLPVIFMEDLGSDLEIVLSDYLIYLERGGEFDAESYLEDLLYKGDSLYSGYVDVSGQVDTNTPGTYYVIYSAEYNEMRNKAVLTVVVE